MEIIIRIGCLLLVFIDFPKNNSSHSKEQEERKRKSEEEEWKKKGKESDEVIWYGLYGSFVRLVRLVWIGWHGFIWSILDFELQDLAADLAVDFGADGAGPVNLVEACLMHCPFSYTYLLIWRTGFDFLSNITILFLIFIFVFNLKNLTLNSLNDDENLISKMQYPNIFENHEIQNFI
ncbi:hypothetical protein BpHYR1_005170 [Brachionus plicatilis]|uniref:Uncharacterized protein n=1 Tax=Brachionus plicatilis TaxID=10195 RepID=A0A3M7RJI2_BRAPC|nr:hypothetical protein BpHYR1_005170 [Brachionus plicatilis]